MERYAEIDGVGILILMGIIVIIIFSAYEIKKFKDEIKRLNAELMDEEECRDLLYDDEGLVVLSSGEVEKYCREVVE